MPPVYKRKTEDVQVDHNRGVNSRNWWEGRAAGFSLVIITVSRLHVEAAAQHNKTKVRSFGIWRAAVCVSLIQYVCHIIQIREASDNQGNTAENCNNSDSVNPDTAAFRSHVSTESQISLFYLLDFIIVYQSHYRNVGLMPSSSVDPQITMETLYNSHYARLQPRAFSGNWDPAAWWVKSALYCTPLFQMIVKCHSWFNVEWPGTSDRISWQMSLDVSL